jgi:hypothetical protein
MPGSLTTPGRREARVTLPSISPSTHRTVSAPGAEILSRLNGWPMRSPVNASPSTSRCRTHDSGPVWFAIPSLQGTFTLYSSPVCPAHSVKICVIWCAPKARSTSGWKSHLGNGRLAQHLAGDLAG